MNVVLVSTYELGHQPFGLASPAAWLRKRGHAVRCLDLSREPLDESAVGRADLVAFHIPMHTATRLAVEMIAPVRHLNPRTKLCFYGLYAPVNESWLRHLGVDAVLGGEFEQGLADLADRLSSGAVGALTQGPAKSGPKAALGRRGFGPDASANAETGASSPKGIRTQAEPLISLARQKFLVPDRRGLVPLDRYARLLLPGGGTAVVGYTEASRGCKHRCRHCPIVPVYNGVFRIVQPEVVLEDVRQQVRAGAEHITFGDPDFFNGPRHALAVVRALHDEFPRLTYDVTIKVEHLLARRDDLAVLRDTGCLFVTTAVESLDDAVLARLEKGHTRADFLDVVRLFEETGLALHPTFIPFTPWTTLEGYADFLDTLASLGLAGSVAPVQLAIRLLVPAGSRLLELEEMRAILAPFDPRSLVYPWRHEDPRVDRLQEEIEEIVKEGERSAAPRLETFSRIEHTARAAVAAAGRSRAWSRPPESPRAARAAIPFLTEPWYC